MSDSGDAKKIIGKALKKAGELLDDESSEQALLVQYQVLQQDSNTMITTHWTVAGIFLGISTGVLGWLVKSIISNDIEFDLTNRTILRYFSLSMALITGLLIWWLYRVSSLVHANTETMKKIASRTRMEKIEDVKGIHGKHIVTAVYGIVIALWLWLGFLAPA